MNRALILKSFFKDLEIIGGSECEDVQIMNSAIAQFEKGEEIEFRGFDMRYNHLCLSNHDILAEKIINALTTGERLDLTTGFIQGIYTSKLLDNPTAELSPTWIKEYQNAKQPHHGWFERFGWIPKN